MTLHTNAGFDMQLLAKAEKDARELDWFTRAHSDAEQRAAVDSKGWLSGGTPEVLKPDSQALARREWSFDDSSGKDAREIRQVREALEYGKLQPKAFVDHGTHVEYVFDNDHVIHAFAEGRACIRCREVPKRSLHEQREAHERTRVAIAATGASYEYHVPEDVMGHCWHCGAVYGGKQQVA